MPKSIGVTSARREKNTFLEPACLCPRLLPDNRRVPATTRRGSERVAGRLGQALTTQAEGWTRLSSMLRLARPLRPGRNRRSGSPGQEDQVPAAHRPSRTARGVGLGGRLGPSTVPDSTKAWRGADGRLWRSASSRSACGRDRARRPHSQDKPITWPLPDGAGHGECAPRRPPPGLVFRELRPVGSGDRAPRGTVIRSAPWSMVLGDRQGSPQSARSRPLAQRGRNHGR